MQMGYIYFRLQTVSFMNAGVMPAFYIPKSTNSWVKWAGDMLNFAFVTAEIRHTSV